MYPNISEQRDIWATYDASSTLTEVTNVGTSLQCNTVASLKTTLSHRSESLESRINNLHFPWRHSPLGLGNGDTVRQELKHALLWWISRLKLLSSAPTLSTCSALVVVLADLLFRTQRGWGQVSTSERGGCGLHRATINPNTKATADNDTLPTLIWVYLIQPAQAYRGSN